MQTLDVLNPVAIGHGELQKFKAAKRPASLDGLRVGLLWNTKPGGDQALARLGQVIQQRYRDVALVQLSGGFPTRADVIAQATRSCDVVIGGSGD